MRDDPAVAREAAARVADWPRISVVVPVGNAREYLWEGLESVVAQTVPPAEVIVVDDGSTDGSAARADEFAAGHAAVRVVRQANGGPGVARNTGIAAASGDVLVFHDADDRMFPERLALQVGYLVARPAVGVVIGATALQFDDSLDPGSELARKERLVADHAEGVNLMVMAARAEVFDRVGGFDPSYRISEDVNWLVRAADAGVVVAFVPAVVTQRRIHDRNVSHAVDDARREMFRALQEHIRARRGR